MQIQEVFFVLKRVPYLEEIKWKVINNEKKVYSNHTIPEPIADRLLAPRM